MSWKVVNSISQLLVTFSEIPGKYTCLISRSKFDLIDYEERLERAQLARQPEPWTSTLHPQPHISQSPRLKSPRRTPRRKAVVAVGGAAKTAPATPTR